MLHPGPRPKLFHDMPPSMAPAVSQQGSDQTDARFLPDYEYLTELCEIPLGARFSTEKGKHAVCTKGFAAGEILFEEARLVGWCNETELRGNEPWVERFPQLPWEQWAKDCRKWKASGDSASKKTTTSIDTLSLATTMCQIAQTYQIAAADAETDDGGRKEMVSRAFEVAIRPYERLCGVGRGLRFEQPVEDTFANPGNEKDHAVESAKHADEQHVDQIANAICSARNTTPFADLPDLCFTKQFLTRLADRLQANVLSYASVGVDGGSTENASVVEFRVFGVFVLTSLLNHSCVPNVEVVADEDGVSIKLQALREIEACEELTIDYLAGGGWVECAERRAVLERHWRFACACEKCVDSALEKDQKDEMVVVGATEKARVMEADVGQASHAEGAEGAELNKTSAKHCDAAQARTDADDRSPKRRKVE